MAALGRENTTGFTSLDTDLYSILCVSSSATKREIEISYRQMSRFIHPDKVGVRSDFNNEFDDDIQTFSRNHRGIFI